MEIRLRLAVGSARGAGLAAIAGGIDSTGKKAHMTYDGKKIVIAKWMSVQRALLLSNALASHLGFAVDEERV